MASSSHLKPGDRGTITAKIDIRNRIGTIFKTVEVYTNDPGKPRVVLTLQADIIESSSPAIQK